MPEPMKPEKTRDLIAMLEKAPALSVRQPWAWSILHAGKDIENRDWPTRFRGPVLLHASKGMTKDEYEDCLETHHLVSRARPFPSGLTMPAFKNLERGGIVGWMAISDCVIDSESPWFCGKYGFVISQSFPTPFTPCKGALGFFRPDIDRTAILNALNSPTRETT